MIARTLERQPTKIREKAVSAETEKTFKNLLLQQMIETIDTREEIITRAVIVRSQNI